MTQNTARLKETFYDSSLPSTSQTTLIPSPNRVSLDLKSAKSREMAMSELLKSQNRAFTGWKVSYPMFSTADAEALGLPVPLAEATGKFNDQWNDIIAEADRNIVQLYPKLDP
jgi:hypothetical protein